MGVRAPPVAVLEASVPCAAGEGTWSGLALTSSALSPAKLNGLDWNTGLSPDVSVSPAVLSQRWRGLRSLEGELFSSCESGLRAEIRVRSE